MFDFLKKERCEYCKVFYRKINLVNIAGYNFCSEKCFINYCDKFSLDELVEFVKLDEKIKNKE